MEENEVSIESTECRLLREQRRELLQSRLTVAALQAFYASYKYLVMSRSPAHYREIGPLLANADKQNLSAVEQRLYELISQALTMPATRGGNINALLHISGYLKERLSPEEKRLLHDCIERYGRGESELKTPIMLLRSYFQRFPHAYIEQQVFLKTV